jgi:predicted nuclease of predicted toxin-antitoxin system
MALMRILAENIPLLAIELLRRKGHDVLAIAESAPSICDEDVMFLAEDEGRILLTFDKDFGEPGLQFQDGCRGIGFKMRLARPFRCCGTGTNSFA